MWENKYERIISLVIYSLFIIFICEFTLLWRVCMTGDNYYKLGIELVIGYLGQDLIRQFLTINYKTINIDI